MAVRKDKVQLEVEINGQKAGETFNDLVNKGRNLNRELGNLTPGTQQFITKATELKAVNSTLADIRNTTKGVAEANQSVPGSYQATIDTVNRLEAELRQLAPSSQAFIDKATELGRVKDELDGIKNATDKITNANKVVPGSYQSIINRADQLEKEIKQLVPGTQQFINKSKELSQVNSQLEKIKSTANGLGGVLGKADGFLSKFGLSLKSVSFIGLATGALSAAKAALDVSSKYETFLATLKTATGSAKEAAQSFELIKQVATGTVFSLDEMAESYVKLRNRGINPAKDEIIALADLAASQGKSFKDLTEALLDAQVGEFERLKEFGIRGKKSGDEASLSFKGFNDTVSLTPEAMTAALVAMGKMEGIAGSNEERMKTLSGRISNLKDAWEQLLGVIGDRGNGILGTFLGILTEIVVGIKNYLSPIKQGTEETGRFAAAIQVLATVFDVLYQVGRFIFDTFTSIVSTIRIFYEEFNKIPVLGKIFDPLIFGLKLLYQGFISLPAVISGFREAAKAAFDNVGKDVTILINSLQILGKEIKLAVTIDKDSRAIIKNEIDYLKRQSEVLTLRKTSIPDAFAKGFNETKQKAEAIAPLDPTGSTSGGNTNTKKTTKEEAEKAEKKRIETRLQEIDNRRAKEVNIELEKFSKKQITEEQFELNKLNITKKFAELKLEYLKTVGKEETEQYLKIETEKLNIATKINEETLKLKKSEIDTELSKIDNKQTDEINVEQEKLNKRIITEEQFELNKLSISKKYAGEKLTFLESVGEQESSIYRKTVSERLDIQKEINEKELENRISQIENSTQVELNEEQKKFISKLTSEEQFELNRLKIIEEGYNKQLKLLEELGLKESALYAKIEQEKLNTTVDISNKIVENELRTANIKKFLAENAVGLTKDVLSISADLLSKDEAARKKHASAIKAFETANILVNLYSEVAGYFKAYSGKPGGSIIAGILSVVAGARSFAAIRKVQAQKFAEGGKIKNYPGLQQPDIITLPDGTEIDATQSNRAKKNSLVGRIKERFFPSEVEQSQPGVIKAKPNIPRQSNGDNVLIAARPGETILNEGQVEKAKAYGGPDFFRRIGVPGFAEGGRVGGPLPGLTPKVSPVSNLSPAVLPNTQPIILNNLAGNNDAMMEVANKFDAAVTRLEKMDIKAKMVYSEFEQIKKDVDYIRGQANS